MTRTRYLELKSDYEMWGRRAKGKPEGSYEQIKYRAAKETYKAAGREIARGIINRA